jgi:hypothetical protein
MGFGGPNTRLFGRFHRATRCFALFLAFSANTKKKRVYRKADQNLTAYALQECTPASMRVSRQFGKLPYDCAPAVLWGAGTEADVRTRIL